MVCIECFELLVCWFELLNCKHNLIFPPQNYQTLPVSIQRQFPKLHNLEKWSKNLNNQNDKHLSSEHFGLEYCNKRYSRDKTISLTQILKGLASITPSQAQDVLIIKQVGWSTAQSPLLSLSSVSPFSHVISVDMLHQGHCAGSMTGFR